MPDLPLTVESVRNLAIDELAGLSDSKSDPRSLHDTASALSRIGLIDLVLGGGGSATTAVPASARALCDIREGLAGVSPWASTVLVPQASAVMLLEDGRARPTPEVGDWARALRQGAAVPGCALSERAAGSDPAGITSEARSAPDGWRLSGTKAWIANAPVADVYLVMARSDDLPDRGVGMFVVPADAPGLRAWETPTSWPNLIGEIQLDNVRVPADNMVGDEGRALHTIKRLFSLFRPSVGAHAIGCAQAALSRAIVHAGQRTTFGRPLSDYQAVSHRLAELHTRLAAARLLVHRAAEAYDSDGADSGDVGSWSAMAKLLATETAQEVVDGAMQVFGAMGLEDSIGLERSFRETRASRIYEGASEIQREIIWRQLSRRATAARLEATRP